MESKRFKELLSEIDRKNDFIETLVLIKEDMDRSSFKEYQDLNNLEDILFLSKGLRERQRALSAVINDYTLEIRKHLNDLEKNNRNVRKLKFRGITPFFYVSS